MSLDDQAVARTKYEELSKQPQGVERILADGARRARTVAQQTMQQVRKACGLITIETT